MKRTLLLLGISFFSLGFHTFAMASSSRCLKETLAIKKYTRDYYNSLEKSDLQEASLVQEKISTLVNGAKSPDHPCSDVLLRSYIRATALTKFSNEYIPLLDELFNKNIVQNIPQDTLDYFKTTQQDEIIGFYDCEKTKIFINPYLAPSDLRSTLIHEIGHFLTDKSIDIFDPKKELSPEESLSVEESIASLHASFIQSQSLTWDLKDSKFIPEQNKILKNDFSFYDPNGNLASWINDISKTTEKFDLHKLFQTSSASKHLGFLSAISSTINNTYFYNATEDFRPLKPEHLDEYSSILSHNFNTRYSMEERFGKQWDQTASDRCKKNRFYTPHGYLGTEIFRSTEGARPGMHFKFCTKKTGRL